MQLSDTQHQTKTTLNNSLYPHYSQSGNQASLIPPQPWTQCHTACCTCCADTKGRSGAAAHCLSLLPSTHRLTGAGSPWRGCARSATPEVVWEEGSGRSGQRGLKSKKEGGVHTHGELRYAHHRELMTCVCTGSLLRSTTLHTAQQLHIDKHSNSARSHCVFVHPP